MNLAVNDTVKIVNRDHMFLGCAGLITKCLETTGIHYCVNLVIPGCQLAQGLEVDGATMIIPVMVREFEIERV